MTDDFLKVEGYEKRIKELEETLISCESALISMVQTWCRKNHGEYSRDFLYSHDFLSAGEEAFEYLVNRGLAEYSGVDIRFVNKPE